VAVSTAKAPGYQELSPAAKSQLDAFISRYAPEGEGFALFAGEILKIPGGEGDLGEPVAFELWPDQLDAALTISSGADIIWLKARQIGATWTVLAYIFWTLMFRKGRNVRSTSIREEDALENIERLNYFWEHLPDWLKAMAPKDPERDNKTTFGLGHTKSYMKALPSTKDAGRSHTLDIFFSDEDASNPHSRENSKSAGPTLEKRGGQYIKVSTAKGFGNHFEEEWHKAEKDESRFTPIFLPWTSDPDRTQDWYDELLRTEGEDDMWQEYPETPRQAFLASGRPFFDVRRIDRELADKTKPKGEKGYLAPDVGTGALTFYDDTKGHLTIYEYPQKESRYAGFNDIAEGLEHGDWTVWKVRNVDTLADCAILRTKCDAHESAVLGNDLGNYYNTALLGAEANGLGVGTVLKLVELHYPNLAWKKDPVNGKIGNKVGNWTDATTRRVMLTLMQGRFRDGSLPVADPVQLREMATFVHKAPTGKPEHEEGCNDDTVLADAGCLLLAEKAAWTEKKLTQKERLEQMFQTKIEGVGAENAAFRDQQRQVKEPGQHINPWLNDMTDVEEV